VRDLYCYLQRFFCNNQRNIIVDGRACERSGSGAENGAERAEKLVSGSGAVSGTSEKREERSGARSGRSGNGNGAGSGQKVVINFLKTCAGTPTLLVLSMHMRLD
jgi:hypothetical protein